MYQIGQFAKLMDISPRMLRHYEKAGILFQMKLIKTGYRYYSAHQIPLLKQILLLRDSGFKVEEMAETLRKLKDASFGNYFVKKTRSIATFNSNGGAKD